MRKIISLIIIGTLLLTITNVSSVQNISWKESNEGLYGGVVTCIEDDLLNENILYAGTTRGGVFVSENNGLSWVANNNGLNNLYIRSLISLPEYIIAGTEDFIYVSEDKGKNWRKITEDIKKVTVNALASTKDKNTLLAGTNEGLYKSNDRGRSWSKININYNLHILSIAIDNNHQEIIYMSCKGKLLLRSLDRGDSWINIGFTENPFDIQNLLINNNNSNEIYAGTENGVLISKNDGISWINTSKGLTNLYITALRQNDNDKEIFASTYGGIFKLNYEDNTWIKLGQDLFNENILSFLINENYKTIIAGTNGGGIYKYEESKQKWTSINNGLKNTHVKVIKCFGSGDRLLSAVWGNGIYKSIDLGNSWTEQNDGITNPLILCIESNGSNVIFAGTFNSGILVSYNFGDTWEKLNAPTLISWYVYSIAFDPKNPKTVYAGTSEGIYRSVDEGMTWSRVFPENNDTKIGEVVDIKFDSNYIYAGTQGTGIYISKDNGYTWIQSNGGLGNLNIQSIQIDTFFTKTIYLSTFGSGVYKSIDGGASWSQMNEGLKNLLVYNLFIDQLRKNYIYAATDTGIYVSDNGAKNWYEMSEGIKDISVRSICYNQADTRIYLGTFGKGVFKSFKIISAPNPESPANKSQITTVKPMLRWTESGETDLPYTYRVLISNDENFSNIVYEKGEILGDQFIIPDRTIEKSKKYYWKVRAETIYSNSTWSKVYSFYTVTRIILRVGDPLMQVDGISKEIDTGRNTTPIIRNTRTFLPIRALVEELGGEVLWNEENKKITINLNNNKIELIIGNNKGIVNGNMIQIDKDNPGVAPFILNGRTMLPIRFIAENIGAEITWEGKSQTITIIYPLIK